MLTEVMKHYGLAPRSARRRLLRHRASPPALPRGPRRHPRQPTGGDHRHGGQRQDRAAPPPANRSRPRKQGIGLQVARRGPGAHHDRHPDRRLVLRPLAGSDVKIPKQDEKRERELRNLFRRRRKPVALFVHLTLAFEEGFRVGEMPIAAEVVEAVLSRQLDDLEPTLTRHGYNVRSLSDQFNAKPAEIKRLLRGELDAGRTRELTDQILAAGLPL